MSEALDIRTRAVLPTDAAIIAGWMRRELPVPSILGSALQPLLSTLLQDERLIGGCIEERSLGDPNWEMAGIGVSGFVADDVIQHHLAAPAPHFPVVLLHRAMSGDRGVFLRPLEVARANASNGLNLVVLYYGQKYKDPYDPRTRRILPYGHRVFLHVHGGYRLRRILQEDWTEYEIVYLSAGYTVAQRFAAGSRCPLGIPPLPADRTLLGLTAEQAKCGVPGATLSFLFEGREPQLRLTRAERRLIAQALDGRTDLEIAKILMLSPNTLKQTWRHIYARVQSRAPFALSETAEPYATATRGLEKRRRLISYMQDHIEEIRPYTEV